MTVSATWSKQSGAGAPEFMAVREEIGEPQNIQQGTEEVRSEEKASATEIRSSFEIPCSIFCGSVPSRDSEASNGYTDDERFNHMLDSWLWDAVRGSHALPRVHKRDA